MHDPEMHAQLAPSDLPEHIVRDHGKHLVDAPEQRNLLGSRGFFARNGIEPTGDDDLNSLLAWHQKMHTYSEMRTPEQRRAEQRPRRGEEHG